MLQIQKNMLKIALIAFTLMLLIAPAGVAGTAVASALAPSNNIAKVLAPNDGGAKKKKSTKKKKKSNNNTIKRTNDPALGKNLCTDKKCPIIHKYVNGTIAALSALVGVVAVIAIIVGGIEFATAGGDPQKSASGRKHIRNALIGLIAFIFFLAFMNFIIPGGIT